MSGRAQENTKRLKYQQQFDDVKHANFHPLIFNCMTGAESSSLRVIEKLADKISQKLTTATETSSQPYARNQSLHC